MDLLKQTELERNKLNDEYDLSDLAANDRRQLEELASANAQAAYFNMLLEEESQKESVDIKKLKDLQILLTGNRKDISTIQSDLKIDRKNREKKTESIPEYIKDLKDRGLKFLAARMSYIYCPKCKFLVGNMWLYKYSMGSKFKFICPSCENSFIVADSDLEQRKNVATALIPKSE